MLKLSTRSITLRDADDMLTVVTRLFLEAYDQARCKIPMPYLTHVEKRVTHSDVSFVLTFDCVRIRAEPGENAINYVLEVPR